MLAFMYPTAAPLSARSQKFSVIVSQQSRHHDKLFFRNVILALVSLIKKVIVVFGSASQEVKSRTSLKLDGGHMVCRHPHMESKSNVLTAELAANN